MPYGLLTISFYDWCVVSCHPHPPLWLWNVDPACWLKKKKKRSRFPKPSVWGNVSMSPTWSTRPTTWCGARSTSLWVHRKLFWQLSRDGNLHGSGVMRHNILSKTFLRGKGWATPWSAEEMLDEQHQRADIPAHGRTAHNGLLQKRLEEGHCWIVPHAPPPHSPTTQSIKGQKWIEL